MCDGTLCPCNLFPQDKPNKKPTRLLPGLETYPVWIFHAFAGAYVWWNITSLYG